MTPPLPQTFWSEMSAEHFMLIYENEDAFLDMLADYVGTALICDEVAVAIATPAHREGLEKRLRAMVPDFLAAQLQRRFLALDAQETLDRFTVNGWPDDRRFSLVASDILGRLARDGRKVNAFGEMVAILWSQGLCGATIRLEQIWSAFCQRETITLFCAYPLEGFTEAPSDSISRVCGGHSRILTA